MTQENLARAMGVSIHAVSIRERGGTADSIYC